MTNPTIRVHTRIVGFRLGPFAAPSQASLLCRMGLLPAEIRAAFHIVVVDAGVAQQIQRLKRSFMGPKTTDQTQSAP